MRGLAGMLTALATVYLCGAAASYGYMRIMLNVSTGTLLSLRQQLFDHMEKLPIRYFDRNTHGDIMSRYTNDIDTIREMLSNSVANFISSSITVISVFIMMLSYSWQLTIVVIAMLFVMLRVVRLVGGKSGAYFVKQQAALGRLNGYIEEMVEGQKVVKVFCHEPQTKAQFDQLNEEMCAASTSANTFANI